MGLDHFLAALATEQTALTTLAGTPSAIVAADIAAVAKLLADLGVGTLGAAAGATTVLFGRIRPLAAWLMVPYLVWISFAGVLTWRIGQLNPDAETLVPAAADLR